MSIITIIMLWTPWTAPFRRAAAGRGRPPAGGGRRGPGSVSPGGPPVDGPAGRPSRPRTSPESSTRTGRSSRRPGPELSTSGPCCPRIRAGFPH